MYGLRFCHSTSVFQSLVHGSEKTVSTPVGLESKRLVGQRREGLMVWATWNLP